MVVVVVVVVVVEWGVLILCAGALMDESLFTMFAACISEREAVGCGALAAVLFAMLDDAPEVPRCAPPWRPRRPQRHGVPLCSWVYLCLCGFDLCHKYILYVYLHLHLVRRPFLVLSSLFGLSRACTFRFYDRFSLPPACSLFYGRVPRRLVRAIADAFAPQLADVFARASPSGSRATAVAVAACCALLARAADLRDRPELYDALLRAVGDPSDAVVTCALRCGGGV